MKTIRSNPSEWLDAISYINDPQTRRSLSAIGLDIIDINEQTYTITLRTLDEYHDELSRQIDELDARLAEKESTSSTGSGQRLSDVAPLPMQRKGRKAAAKTDPRHGRSG